MFGISSRDINFLRQNTVSQPDNYGRKGLFNSNFCYIMNYKLRASIHIHPPTPPSPPPPPQPHPHPHRHPSLSESDCRDILVMYLVQIVNTVASLR